MKRLRVALETQFAVARSTGVGVYARGLADALRTRTDVELLEICDPRFDLWRFDRRVYWDQILAPHLARSVRADVYHFTAGTLPWRTPRPVVLTLHDLVWLRGANRGRPYVRWYFGRMQAKLARGADAIVVDTRAARDDVAGGLGVDRSRITVAGAGVDAEFFWLVRRPAPPFALVVGTVEERKDLATAVRAIGRIPTLRLVSVGPPTPYARSVEVLARELALSDRVELRGYVADAALRELFATAAVLVAPSRYEGFGLPPLQALAAGVPVVAAKTAVAYEVLGECAGYCAPGDVAGMTAAIEAALAGGPLIEDRVARGRERARQFTWERVAAAMVEVYRSVAAQ